MTKLFKPLLSFLIISTVLFSCKSELDLDKTIKFSKLSVEEQKAKIEESGIEFINTMEGMQDTKAFTSMDDFMENNAGILSVQLNAIKNAAESNSLKSISILEEQMIGFATANDDDEIWGEYDWNSKTEMFDKKSGSESMGEGTSKKVIFNFPATSSDKSNSASFTATYTESKVKMPDTDEYMPASINCTLLIDGAKALTFEYKGEYNTDATPTKTSSSLDIEDYSWNVKYVNDTEELSEEFEMKHKRTTLMKMSAKAEGDFTYKNIERMDTPDELVTSFALYYQLMDIAVIGGMKDVAAFVKEGEAIDNDNEKEEYEEVANVINNHLILYGYFVSDNKKFADVEFSVIEDTYSYTYLQWNGSYYQEVEVKNSDYELVPMFVLSDGSKVDLEDYFTTGFDKIFEELEDLGEGLEF